jgi:hypothetical protein
MMMQEGKQLHGHRWSRQQFRTTAVRTATARAHPVAHSDERRRHAPRHTALLARVVCVLCAFYARPRRVPAVRNTADQAPQTQCSGGQRIARTPTAPRAFTRTESTSANACQCTVVTADASALGLISAPSLQWPAAMVLHAA